MNLGEHIFRHRSRLGWSQDRLAAALEVSRQSVSKWETGAAVPDLDRLVKMADLFGISLDELVGHAVPSPAAPPDVPAPAPAAPSVTSGDLVSILILLFAVLIPVVIMATSELHDSTFLLVLGFFILPPLATICASFSSPKNKVLFIAFAVYDVVFGLIACIMGSVLAPIIAIVYIFAVGFWNDKLEKPGAPPAV